MLTLAAMLQQVIQVGGSDLHLTPGTPPQIRVDGKLRPLGSPPLTAADTERLAYSIMTDAQKQAFEDKWELDFSFCIRELSRFRADVFRQSGAVACAFRAVPFEIKSFETLGLPPVVERLCDKPRGLILVTGPTGSGKSTTLAAMIDRINRESSAHILTIEDPIEFMHSHKKCIVNQREVGADTNSFATALKYVLRQDPDIILVGEMRDLETIQAAITIAETGHLVYATLHTNSAAEAVNRIVDVFPSDQRRQIFTQLAFTLEGIVTQALLPRSRGAGRVMLAEVLVCTPAIKAVIREGKTHQIYSLMQAGQKFGMQTMNQALLQAVQDRALNPQDALDFSHDRQELEGMLAKVLRAAA